MGERQIRRDRMRSTCVLVYYRLLNCREVALDDLADEAEVSVDTVRRWVHSFKEVMPIEIRKGRVVQL